MGEVFIKFLNMSITAGILVLAVVLVRLIFRRKAPKALFPVLWALVAVRLICPVTFESSFSLIPDSEPVTHVKLKGEHLLQTEKNSEQMQPVENVPGKIGDTVSEKFEKQELPDNTDDSTFVENDTPNIGDYSSDGEGNPFGEAGNSSEVGDFVPVHPNTEDINGNEILPGVTDSNKEPIKEFNPGESDIRTDNTDVLNTDNTEKSNEINSNVKKTDSLEIAAIIWMVGIGIMLFYTAFSYIRIYRRVAESAPIADKVRVCDGIDSPFILGIIRPMIYLPSDIAQADKEYVLAHEKAHLKRLDHIWKPFGFLLLTVYWFNPLLWVAYVLLCKDIEFACDEKVINELGTEQKKPYSEALINCSVSKKMVSACPLAFGENGVKGRVKSVLHYKKPAFWVLVVSVLVCIAMAVCFLTNPKEKETKVTPEPTPTVTSAPVITEPPEVSQVPTEADIPLDDKHFTSKNFREYLSVECDSDKNGYLSEAERAEVRYLYLEAPVEAYNTKTSGFDVLDGFEYFPNLRYVYTNNAKQMIFNHHPSIRYVEVKGGLAYLHVENCPKFQVISSSNGAVSSFFVSDVAQDCIYQGQYISGRDYQRIVLPLDSRCSIRLENQDEFQEIRSTKSDSAAYYKAIPIDWLERTEKSIGIRQQSFESYFVGKDIDFLKARIYDKERDREYVFLTEEEENSASSYLWIYDGVIITEEDEIEVDQYRYTKVPVIPEGVSEESLYLRTGQKFYVDSVTAWADKGVKLHGSINLDILYQENGEEHKLATIDDFGFYVYIDESNRGQLIYRMADLYDMLRHTPDTNEIKKAEVCFSSKALQNYLNKTYNSDEEEGLSKSERENVYYLNYLSSVSLYKEHIDGLDHLPNLTDLYISNAESLVIDGHPSLEYIVGDVSELKKVIIKNCPKLRYIDIDLSVVEEVEIEGCYNLENEYNKNSGELATLIQTTNISIAIGNEYAAYLDENGKLHVLYDTSYRDEYDSVGSTGGIDTSKTYKALGTDPLRLVAIDEEGRLSVSYYNTAEEMQAILEQILKEVAEAGGNYGGGKPDPAIAKDFETISGVKQIFSEYPYDRYTALFEDGTVCYLGERVALEGVVQVTAKTNGVIAGLKEDGTLVMTEVSDIFRKKKLDTWPKQLKQIASGHNFFVGLKPDGTVISEGAEQEYMINTVEQWSGIEKIAVANETVIGLKGDGTVVAVCPGRSDVGQCEVDDWTDVIAINTNGKVTVGITKDEKVLMAGAVPEIVKGLPERYNYEEIKSVFLEYLNHQAWLYPTKYPQESYTCSYEVYRTETEMKRVLLKAVIKETEYWFDFEPEQYFLPDSPVRVTAGEPNQMRHYVESGSFIKIGNDKLYVPAVTKPMYENPVDLTEEISYIYADLKANGYGEDLRIEAIVSACDMEKKLYPYVYLIINDSEVYETTFTDEYTLSRTFFDDNYYIDYSLNYGTGGAWLFDGHGIEPVNSVDTEQFERVKACASFHKTFEANDKEVVMIAGEAIELPNTNVAISEELGVGIAFVSQWCLSNTVHYNIYRSEDSGKSWRMIAEDFTATEGGIARILIPEKDTIVCYFNLSGTTSQSSCQVSEDRGITWKYATYASKPNDITYNPQKDRSVIFGAYEQDGDFSNGAEPLEWLVLDRDGDWALLLAKYGIETMLFDKNESVHPWSDSELYRIINRELYQYMFSEEERAALLQTNSIKDSSLALSADMERLFYHGYTFLLETDDVLYGKKRDEMPFFRTEESRITIPTAYAAQKGAWNDKDGNFIGLAAPWLLTVTGTTDGDFKDVEFARVMRDGSISFEEEAILNEYVLIRPAIWVDVTKLSQ